jgi:tRNA (guanine-N7-)-methyltransferase
MTAPHVPSFRSGRGRLTPRQQRAIETLWSTYVVDPTADFDPVAVYGRLVPLVLDVGFGMGETTATLAEAEPDRDVLAVEVHRPGAGALLHEIGERRLTNVRLVLGDVVDVLRDMLAPGSLDEVRIFFPDPWPKVRHHKRRLVAPPFVELVATRLRPGGRLHCATDWAPYARQMLAAIAVTESLANPYGGYAPRPDDRPVTRFERRGLDSGHQVFDVVAVRRG